MINLGSIMMRFIKPFTAFFLFMTLSIPLSADEGWSFWHGYQRYLHRLPKDISNEIFLRADTDKKIVAITFDDGPLKRTPKIINFLSSHNIPATFFILASQLSNKTAKYYNNPLFTTAIHGYRHYDYRKLSAKKTDREIERAVKIFEHYHLRHDLFRPPYGMLSHSLIRILKEHHIRPVIWSIDSRDWSRKYRTTLVNRVLNHLSPGSVILFHDHGVRLKQLEEVLRGIKEKGYNVVSIEELMSYHTLYP